MQITFQASTYKPELVTGVYARIEGSARKGYRYKVIEAASGTIGGVLKAGHGFTLREYYADISELPSDLIERCKASKSTELWKYL